MLGQTYIRILLVLMFIWMILATTELVDTEIITQSQLKIEQYQLKVKQYQFQEKLEKIFMMVSDDVNIAQSEWKTGDKIQIKKNYEFSPSIDEATNFNWGLNSNYQTIKSDQQFQIFGLDTDEDQMFMESYGPVFLIKADDPIYTCIYINVTQEEMKKFKKIDTEEKIHIYLCQVNIVQVYMELLKCILRKYQKMKDDINDDFDLAILTSILTPLPLDVRKITNQISFNHRIENFDISSDGGSMMMIKRIENTAENKISIRNGIVISFITNLHYPSLFVRYYGYVEDKNYLYVISEYLLSNITTFNDILFEKKTREKINNDNRLSFLMNTTKDIKKNRAYFNDAKRNCLYPILERVNKALKKLYVEHKVMEYEMYEKKIWFQEEPKFEDFKIDTLEDFQFIMKTDFKNSTLVPLKPTLKTKKFHYYDNRYKVIRKMLTINNSKPVADIQNDYQEVEPNFKLVHMLPEKQTPSNSIHESLFENFLNKLNEPGSNYNTEFDWKKQVPNKKEAKKYNDDETLFEPNYFHNTEFDWKKTVSNKKEVEKYSDDETLFEPNYFQTLELGNTNNLNDLTSKSVKKNRADNIQSKKKLNDPAENIWSSFLTLNSSLNFKKSGLNYFRKHYQKIWDMILKYTGIVETITKLSVINSKFFTNIAMIRRKYFDEKTALPKPMKISEKSLHHLANYKLLRKFDSTEHVFFIYFTSPKINEHTLKYFSTHTYYVPPLALQNINPHQLIKLFIGKSQPTEFWYNSCTKQVVIYNHDTMKVVDCFYTPIQLTKCFRFVLEGEKTERFEIKFYIDEIVNISIMEHTGIFRIHFENSEGTTATYCICKKYADSFTKGIAKISERYLFCNNFDLFKILDY